MLRASRHCTSIMLNHKQAAFSSLRAPASCGLPRYGSAVARLQRTTCSVAATEPTTEVASSSDGATATERR